MGWWQCYDNTIIGDELADLVDKWMDVLIADLATRYPSISRDQVLHTIAFCSGYLPHLDKDRKLDDDSDKALGVMTIKQKRRWDARHEVPPDISKRVAPDTALVNVFNPFTGTIV